MATFKQYEGWFPGVRLPLNWPIPSPGAGASQAIAENSLLASVLDASEGVNYCWTIRERTILSLINKLTDMPNWQCKIFSPNFTFRWKSAQVLSGKDVTKPMADWCVEEVKSYVQPFYKQGIVPAIDGGVVKSDIRTSATLLHDVQQASAALRKRSSRRPSKTDGVITLIVDPFLCPFSWENSRYITYDFALTLSDCLQRIGEGDSLWKPKEEQCIERASFRYPNDQAFSRRFQWIPFEVKFDENGGSPRITSYINNVHPRRHRDFYTVLESLIAALIPMLDQSLMESRAPHYENIRLHVAVLESGFTPTISKDVGNFTLPQQRSTKQFIDRHHRWQDWLKVNLKKEFWSRGLQMICEVRDIDLTPDHPNFRGENWHVKGQRNEYICASSILTYGSHNVTRPQLSFRRRVWTEEASLAWGYITEPPFAPDIYGAKTGDPVIQHIGDVSLFEGRLVTFPNIWQTRLLPFDLVDKGRPGYLKLLTLHLIDPNRRIISTSRVPPQQREWWSQEVRQRSPVLWRLPNEIWTKIVSEVDGLPLTDEEAELTRSEFLQERAEYQRKHTEAMMDYGEWDLDSDAE